MYLGNLLPSSVLPDHKSPYEILVGRVPVYTSLRLFGCSCYPFLRPYSQNKFNPKSLHCLFIGYSEKHKGYQCLHPPSGRVYISRHVLFEESKFPYQKIISVLSSSLETPLLSVWLSDNENVQSPEEPATPPEEYIPKIIQPQAPTLMTPASTPSTRSIFSDADFPLLPSPAASHVPPIQQVPHEEHVHPMVTRAKDGIRKPNPRYVLLTVTPQYPEPRTLAAALKDPNWTNAMKHEKGNMEITHTWDLVPPDPNIKPISCGWIHKSKLNTDGTLNKRKSRLVARGNEQEEGIDFVETYSLVV